MTTTATKSRSKSGGAVKTGIPESSMDTLVRKLNKARIEAGITINQLADQSGTSTPNLYQFFAGKVCLKPPVLNKVVKILGGDPDEAVEVFIQNQCERIRRKYSV